LVELRKAAGLSQQQLGQEVGISRSYVAEIEAGVKTPSGMTAKRMAERLQFDMSRFFG
jgi:transcriptional regulator with XRE-family HTH domain